jgi:hypothetical protein
MKKSTAKAAKTTTPVKKAPAKVIKKAAAVVKRTVKAAPAKTAKAPVVKAPAAKAPAVKAPAAKAPAVKASAAKLSATAITALIDIGFGNTLYVRGEGPGLSWDVGVPLDCAADNKWTIALPATGKAVIYKFLINDLSWSAGPDYVTESGSAITVEPTF